MNHLKSVATRIAFVALLLTLGFAPAASATTNTFEILMDLDNNQATGCDVPTLSSPFHGVEQILITTVTTSGSTAQVTALQVETCNAGVFSAPAPVPAPVGHPLPWTVGTLNGTSSPSFIETYFPLSSSVIPSPTSVRLGVLAFDSSNALTDDLLATAAGGPIVLQAVSPLDIPTLGDGGLMALGLVLALAAMALLRRRRTAGTVLLALLLLSAAGLSWAAVGSTDLNGATTSEWSGASLLATAPPSTPHPDVEALYGFKDPTLNALAFRVDSQLVFTTPQTITFTSTPPASATVGGPTYTVTATASSGLPVTFTIDPSASAVCSISGSTVSFTGVGTCVIDANQAGDSNYDPAPQAQQSFGVGKGAQTIAFTSTAPASATVGGPTYNVAATASPSGLPVSFTIDASATAVCSISGSTVSFTGVGTCVVDADQAGDANYNAAPQAQQSFAVGKGAQTIAFTSTAPASATVGGPTYNVTATASPSGLPVSFTIDASATSVCSISGSTVSFTAIGTCVIDANQAGDANYNAAPQVQQSFSVGKGDQTISFTSTAPATAKVGGPTYTVTATASSSLTVAFTIDASATSVCSISGSTVSFLAIGTCVIDANQAGDANWNAAPQVQQSFPVGKGDQTISFTSTAPASATVGGPTYTVTATASPSGLPVAFTIDASATSVCSISGSTVSFIAVGTCVIDANQAGNANYNAATQVQQSFPVGKGNQTISFTSTAPASAKVGGPTYTVTATASPSGLPVAFTIDATATSVCSISGSTVSFTAVGTCVIDANQAGNANYNAATQVQQSFPVAKGDQTISFTSTAPVNAKVGGPTYTVTATASPSGLPVTFTIDATATSVCSISGSTVSFLAIGTCVIDANQAGNANYNAATQVQQSFPVAKGDQTISFTSTAPASAKVGGPTYTVTATASPSGLPVTFTIDASATSVCSIAGSTVSFTGVGTCVIDANQAGNANYNAATQVQQSFPVAKGDQTISFTSTAPASAKVGGPTYTVTATASPSGLPVTFTIDASATSVCSIAGSTVSFTGVGTCVIDANQAGNASYNAAPQVQQSFPVAKGDQTISFTSTAPAGATVGGPTYTVTATASPSGLPVAFTIDAAATSVCSISGSTVSFIGVGTCVIDANQAGNASYNAAPQVQQSFAVGKGSQTISFTSTAPVGATVGGPTYTVTATATSGLPVTFTIDASATSVCSISGSTVSFLGAGTCVIDANQAGNANYSAAPQVQQSFAVSKGSQTISFTSAAPASATVGGPTYTVTATATSGLPVAFTIDASATSVCSISGSTVSFIGVGTCVIDANQAGNASYNAAPQVQQSFAVGKGAQTISFTSTAPVGAAVGGPTYTVTATATSGLAVTFTIDATATSVCSISGSTVSFIGAGTCVIDANQAGNASYNAAPQAQQSFAVGKGSQTISFTSTAPVGATVGSGSYTVTATATSGLAVTFTIDATATSVCSISGSTVSFIGAGTCVIDANQTGNANYNAAPQAQQSFAINKGSQTISFTSTPPSPAIVGGTYTVSATATSGLTVTFTIDATATSVCSISGSTVMFIGTGTCVIDANQAGNASYNAAPQVQQSFQVDKAPQITSANATSFTSTVPGTFTVTTTGFPTGASMSITESGDTLPSGVTFVNNNDGTATLAGTPAAGTQGVYHITITANNGIPPNATQMFTLTVLNNPPQLTTNPISYTTPGNTQLQVAGATLPGVAAWNDPQSINAKAQPTDTDGPGPLSIVAASGTTGNGGSYSINTDGSFTYVPAAGFTGTDTFTYQVTDTQSTTTGTINITVGTRVWYIRDIVDANNPAGGDGRSTNAFDSIAAFNAATTNAGDIIYVFQGNTATTPLSGSITLKDSQKLWGQGIDLNVPGFGTPLVTATSKAHIRSTAASTPAVSIPATAGNRNFVEVRGLDLSTTGATSNAVDVTSSGANTVSVTISDNNVSGATAKGVNLSEGGTGSFTATLNNNALAATGNAFDANTTAGAGTLTISFTNNAVVSNATGININGSAGGTTWITNFANNAVSQNNVGTGIAITSAKFDATPGGGYQTVSGGTTVVGVSGNGVGGSGVVLSNVSGDLAFTDLDIFADGGSALSVTGTGAVNTGAGTGTRVTVGAGVATFEAVGGPAASVTSATIDLQLASLKSTNSSTTGVSLDTVAGTFSAGSGSTITNATGTDFNVNAGNATVTYNGTITDTTGRLVSVTGATGGTISFTGAISDTNSGTGQGIFLNSNTGATISFSAPLTLSTGGNNAFTATGGGTVTSTDTTSTIVTTTGTALNVANTTIGASGLKFKSISAGTAASGPTNGIVLNNTGASGGLTVSGTGAAGSGGTIQKTTGASVSLTSTTGVGLSFMNIQNSAAEGILGTSVNGFSLTSCSVTGNGAPAGTNKDGIKLIDTTNAVTFTNDTVTGNFNSNVQLTTGGASSAAMTTLTVTNGTYSNSTQNAGFLVDLHGTASLATALVSGATFSGNFSKGIQFQHNDNATMGNGVGAPATGTITVNNCTFTNNDVAASFESGGNGNGSAYYRFTNNATITGSHSLAVNFANGSTVGTGTFKVFCDNNHIGTAGVPNSGAAIGEGIRLFAQGKQSVTAVITNNVIRDLYNGAGGFDARGIDVEELGSSNTGQGQTPMDVTITGNNVDQEYTGSTFNIQYAIYVACDGQASGSGSNVRADIHGNTVPTQSACDSSPCAGNDSMIWMETVSNSNSPAGALYNLFSEATVNAAIINHNTGTAGKAAATQSGAGQPAITLTATAPNTVN